MEKKIVAVRAGLHSHWVGNGFPVATFFHYKEDPHYFSPFLLLDYVSPYEFKPGKDPRGVGEHPHRGIETVTIAFAGEITHRDSHGGSGTITEGGVQWMTAGRGVVHEEMHSDAFLKSGGPLEMVQLWTNLPKAKKMTAPRYQAFEKSDFPTSSLAQKNVSLTLISGTFANLNGPAKTFTPMDVGILDFKAGSDFDAHFKEGYSALLLVRKGTITIGGKTANAPSLVVLTIDGSRVKMTSPKDSSVVFFSGEPIREPQVGHGPFVMNSQEEIAQAYQDYEQGLMGHLKT